MQNAASTAPPVRLPLQARPVVSRTPAATTSVAQTTAAQQSVRPLPIRQQQTPVGSPATTPQARAAVPESTARQRKPAVSTVDSTAVMRTAVTPIAPAESRLRAALAAPSLTVIILALITLFSVTVFCTVVIGRLSPSSSSSTAFPQSTPFGPPESLSRRILRAAAALASSNDTIHMIQRSLITVASLNSERKRSLELPHHPEENELRNPPAPVALPKNHPRAVKHPFEGKAPPDLPVAVSDEPPTDGVASASTGTSSVEYDVVLQTYRPDVTPPNGLPLDLPDNQTETDSANATVSASLSGGALPHEVGKRRRTPRPVIGLLEGEMSDEERLIAKEKWSRFHKGKALVKLYWSPKPHTLEVSSTFPPPKVDADQYIFGDDVLFVIVTEKKNHGLIKKIMLSWGQYVKRFLILSDTSDRGLNTTVLKNPSPTSVPRDYKTSPWRVTAMLQHLYKTAWHHASYYIVIDQYSFPLLDQIRWRIDNWKGMFSGTFPPFMAGRKGKAQFTYTYWPSQQETAEKIFLEELSYAPWYMFGFDHASLEALRHYLPIDVCPVLTPDHLALSGLLVCAGGLDQEWDFLIMTRYSHREKNIIETTNTNEWRSHDVYSHYTTGGIVIEAFQWYYSKLIKRV